MMPSFASWSLCASLLVAGYVQILCTTAPNKAVSHHHTDRIRFLTGPPMALSTPATGAIILYQALVALFYRDTDHTIVNQICPHPEHLSDYRFTWNPRIIGYLALVAVGAWVRLSAYGGLGRNFTFQLAQPDRLITTGVYRFLQHPSYTGLGLVLVGYAGLVVNRWDTALACVIPGELLQILRQWEPVMGVLGLVIGLGVLRMRVGDEERMLRDRFGKEWQEWHRRTARFIPGIF